eukprot:m.138990 g.138990  ORF g.138990 m.138990 type:complete len:64 (-) comp13162_c0_seq27:71-262(-)
MINNIIINYSCGRNRNKENETREVKWHDIDSRVGTFKPVSFSENQKQRKVCFGSVFRLKEELG